MLAILLTLTTSQDQIHAYSTSYEGDCYESFVNNAKSGIPILEIMQSYTNIEDNLESFNVITYEMVSEYAWLSQLVKHGSIVADNQLLAQYCDITYNNSSGTIFEKGFPDGASQYYDISYMEIPHGFDGQYIKGYKLERGHNDPHILNHQYATVTLKDHPWLQLPSHNHYTWFPMSEKAIDEFKSLVEKHGTYFFKIIDNAGENNFVNLRHATMSDKQHMMMYPIHASDSKVNKKQISLSPPLKQIKNDIPPISDTFVVMTDHVRYNVPYHITNGTMETITVHCELSSLVIQIDPDGNGELTLEIPRELLDNRGGNRVVGEGDNGFFMLLDGEEIEYEENKYDNTRAIMIQFVLDSKELEIIGPFLYPEDGIDACKIVHNPPYSYVLPPLKQIEHLTDIHKIICKDSLILVQRYDGSPACIKPETKQKLIERERGWINHNEYPTVIQQQIYDNRYSIDENGMIDWHKIKSSPHYQNEIDYSRLGYLVSETQFKKMLYESEIKYNENNFIVIAGPEAESEPPRSAYCGYVKADAKEGEGGREKDYWYTSGFYRDTLTSFDLHEDNPDPCKSNHSSCSCTLQRLLAVENLKELSYFDNPQQEEFVGKIVSEYLEKTKISNVSNQFVVGKYNLDLGSDEAISFCGKFVGTTYSVIDMFEGTIEEKNDDANAVVGFSVTQTPELCAISDDATTFDFTYSGNN